MRKPLLTLWLVALLASVSYAQTGLVVNEVMVGNIDVVLDPSVNYGDWIELYNAGAAPIDLSACYVTDDPLAPKKYALARSAGSVAPQGFTCLYFDHYEASASQVNFKLDIAGGTIYITSATGEVLAQATYPAAISRTSYARTADGGDEWAWTETPTPAASNQTAFFTRSTERLSAVAFSAVGCFFTGEQQVTLTAPRADALIYYTTDGSTPTRENGARYDGEPLRVAASTVVRARCFAPMESDAYALPSVVSTQSYILRDKDFQLPIVSVTTDPRNLYDDEIGCYVRGTNGKPGNGQSTACNWNMDWDRPVNFEFFTTDGEQRLNQEVNFAVCGGWSRANEPRSFKLKANKRFEGAKSMQYPLFSHKPNLRHKTLQMRAGGNDNESRIKDAALQTIVQSTELDIESQSYEPTLLYINGQRIGLINMREPNNKHYAYANYNLDDDLIDQFEIGPDSCYAQMCGTREAFDQWCLLAPRSSDPMVYEEIKRLVDVDEFANYMAVQCYLGLNDWPRNNVKAFRPKDGSRGFRFVLFDLDSAFGTTSPFNSIETQEYAYGDVLYPEGERLYLHNEFITTWKNMLQSDEFRQRFTTALQLVAGCVFRPDRIPAIVDSLANRTAETLSWEGFSPLPQAYAIENALSTKRQTSIMSSLLGYYPMGLYQSSLTPLSISTSGTAGGRPRILMNDQPLPTERFSGPSVLPLTLRAEAPGGYRFVGWQTASDVETSLLPTSSWWRYYDRGSLEGQLWTDAAYDDSQWSEGQAPLGYTSDKTCAALIHTSVNPGADPSNKTPTYYFRTTLTLDKAPDPGARLVLNYKVDDGMAVYINGQQVHLYRLLTGAKYDDYATDYAGALPDEGSATLDAALLHAGTNVIAVEVHNSSAGSSDIFFDLSLGLAQTQSQTREYVSREPEYTLAGGTGAVDVVAVFEPLTEEERSAPVRINEVGASNTIFFNDLYKSEDYVELYNTTGQNIDLAGVYFSDNIGNPRKYQIAASEGISTIIPAYGFQTIWCDKKAGVSALHAPFKLAAEGDTLLLTAADGSWQDVFTYAPHTAQQSVGRYPDGADQFYVMNRPTQGKTNIYTAYAQSYAPDNTLPEEPETDRIDAAKANAQLVAFYVQPHLMLRLDGACSSPVTVQIFDTAGRLVAEHTVRFAGGRATIAAPLSSGVYVARVGRSAARFLVSGR